MIDPGAIASSPRVQVRAVKAMAMAVGVAVAWVTWGTSTGRALVRDLFLSVTLDFRPAREADVVLVTVDDDDLALYHSREPRFLDRRTYAKVVDRLTEYGASLIVFDVLFDRPTPGDPAADALLASSLHRDAPVILAQVLAPGGRGGAAGAAGAAGATAAGAGDGAGPAIMRPIPLLEEAAAGGGYVNINPDPDGVIRHVMLLARGASSGDYFHYIALEAAMHMGKFARAVPGERGIELLSAGGSERRFIPCGADGASLVRMDEIPAIRRITVHALLEPGDKGDLHRMLVKGRVVVIGSSSRVLQDTHAYLRSWITGAQVMEDGVWLVACNIQATLSGAFLVDVTAELGHWPILIFLAIAWLLWTLRPLRCAFLTAVLLALIWIGAGAAYRGGFLLDGAGLTAGLSLLAGLQLSGRALADRIRLVALTSELQGEIAKVRARAAAPAGDEDQKTERQPRLHVMDKAFIARFLPERYTDLQYLAQGGTAVVYRARDAQRGIWVAMKVLSPLLQDNPTAVRRFLGEGRTMRRLSHPGLVAVLDVERDVLPYFTMELVEGQSLGDVLHDGGPIPPGRVIELGKAIARVLAYIHDKGVVHRDIKPSNVMLRPDGSIKLLDFGLARDEDMTSMTRTGDVMGTLRYMAPEQLAASETSPATDVYSLAVVMCELAMGQAPMRQGFAHVFPRKGLEAIFAPALIELLERSLKDLAALRPQDGAEFLALLEKL